jgi:hypothetical protein
MLNLMKNFQIMIVRFVKSIYEIYFMDYIFWKISLEKINIILWMM